MVGRPGPIRIVPAAPSGKGGRPIAAQPHILILMSDQHRADCLGVAGHPVVRTPGLDRIAAEGVRFDRAVTTCPLCTPARVSFITGQYCHNLGIWDNTAELAADSETFFRHLQRAGYLTGYIGKSHFYPPTRGAHMRSREPYMQALGIESVHEATGPHFSAVMDSYMTDRWRKLGLYETFVADMKRCREHKNGPCPSRMPDQEYLDSYIGRQGVEFIDGHDGDRPMCLFVSFGGPHEPFDAPAPYATMYDPADCPPAIPPEPIPDDLSPVAASYVASRDETFHAGADSPQQVAAARANYYGKISLIDHWIGRMHDALGRRGWLDDTMIVYLSDHGEMIGDHGRFHKSCFYEASVRIPLLLRWPGRVPAGQVRSHLAESIDVFDTLLEAAGCEPSGRSQGLSLLAAARDPSAEHRDACFSEVLWHVRPDETVQTTMIATDRHVYAVSQRGEPLALFDLAEDPLEQENLAGRADLADLRAQLERRMVRWRRETQVQA